MKIPRLKGIIRRRILLNYRVDPEVVKKVLPATFRPKLVEGYSIVGICLIRLEEIRPLGFPAALGVSSENSAHRIAVEWEDEEGRSREGVFVPRRDTNSRLNSWAGGRLFPGIQHHASFGTKDEGGQISIKVVVSDLEQPLVELRMSETDDFPASSVFSSLEDSSQFFESGCVGYSSRPNSCQLDGMLLKVNEWQVSSLDVEKVRSAYFDDQELFPARAIELDHALLMRNVPHEWHSEPEMTGI